MSNNVCPNCGNTFTCGMENGEASCWCFDLPNIIPLDTITDSTATACLCPQCLQARIDTMTVAQRGSADTDS